MPYPHSNSGKHTLLQAYSASTLFNDLNSDLKGYFSASSLRTSKFLNFILSFVKCKLPLLHIWPFSSRFTYSCYAFRKYSSSLLIFVVINTGCYIAARSYEISLQVLTNISQVSAANDWNIFSTREEKFRSSKWPCNVLFIIQTPMKYQTISLFKIVNNRERRNLLCSHSNGDISLVKITFYFHMSRYHVFPLVFYWCLFHKVIVLHCNVLVLVNNK